MAIKPEELLRRCKEKHGDRYDYSASVFTGIEKKVTIRCRVHGNFEQTPVAHYRLGQGCRSCNAGKWRLLDTATFTEKAESLHGSRYDYSLVNYTKSSKHVAIRCTICRHTFQMTPNNHLNGKGCRHCNLSGFTLSKPARLYVLESATMFKVGVTNKTAQTRAADVSRSSSYRSEVVVEYHLDGRTALAVESKLLVELKRLYQQPVEKFNGSTECFLKV